MRTWTLIPLLLSIGCAGGNDGADDPIVQDTSNVEPDRYECGWPANDPGTLQAGTAQIGDVVGNLTGVDQCGEQYSIWDGHSEYMMVVSPPLW